MVLLCFHSRYKSNRPGTWEPQPYPSTTKSSRLRARVTQLTTFFCRSSSLRLSRHDTLHWLTTNTVCSTFQSLNPPLPPGSSFPANLLPLSWLPLSCRRPDTLLLDTTVTPRELRKSCNIRSSLVLLTKAHFFLGER